MPIKYVRDNYRDHARGVMRNLTPLYRPPQRNWPRRGGLRQITVLLAIISMLFIVEAVLKQRRGVSENPLTASATVTGKQGPMSDDVGTHYLVDLAVALEGEGTVDVTTECTREVWESLSKGDAVTIDYRETDVPNVILIQGITRLPPDQAPQDPEGT